MSLILEALKKSEAERRIGEAPDLLSPSVSVAAKSRRASRTWLWVLLPTLLLLALAAAWWLGRAGGPGADTAARDDNDSPAVATDDPDTRASPPSAATGVESTAGQRRANTAEAAIHTPTTAAPAPPPGAASSSQTPVTAMPRAPGERESMPVTPGTLPALSPRPVEQPAVEPAPLKPDTAPTPGNTTPEQPAPATLPLLRQLDSATRGELPPLRISMHVFTEQPDGRFVIIDNHRYGEGASVASGLSIAEIRRDGVVMDYRGRRFLLDRPG